MKRIYFRLELGLKSDKIPNTTMNHAPLITNNSDLDKYAESVRLRIKMKKNELFPNKSGAHANVILREFIKSATSSIKIFCGSLCAEVYGNLRETFEEARSRDVSIQVITALPSKDIKSTELAKWFVTNGAPLSEGILHSDVSEEYRGCPHFAVVDDVMYRLEIDPREKSAVVCAYAGEGDSKTDTVKRLMAVFPLLWKNSKRVRLSEEGALC